MGIGINLLVIMTVVNVGLLFFGFDSGATTLYKFVSVDPDTGQVSQGTMLYDQLLTMIGISTGLAITTGAGFYLLGQAQYGIFASIVAWLMGFAFLPSGLLLSTELPLMVKAIIISALFMGYILSLVAFFRGADL